MKTRAQRLARWITLGEKLLDDAKTGYIEVYEKDGNFINAKRVERELIELNFEEPGMRKTGQ